MSRTNKEIERRLGEIAGVEYLEWYDILEEWKYKEGFYQPEMPWQPLSDANQMMQVVEKIESDPKCDKFTTFYEDKDPRFHPYGCWILSSIDDELFVMTSADSRLEAIALAAIEWDEAQNGG